MKTEKSQYFTGCKGHEKAIANKVEEILKRDSITEIDLSIRLWQGEIANIQINETIFIEDNGENED